MNAGTKDESEPIGSASVRELRDLLEQARKQTALLAEISSALDLGSCYLDKIASILCVLANETHRTTVHVTAIKVALDSLIELYQAAHPQEALQLEKLAKLRKELEECCPPCKPEALICHYEPCQPVRGIRRGDGYSAKSRGGVAPVPFSERPHDEWTIVPKAIPHEADEKFPPVPMGPIVGPIVPSAPTPQPANYQSGTPTPGPQDPVTFRTFTEGGVVTTVWPPDMTGAKAGDVVLMAGNLWFKLSTDA